MNYQITQWCAHFITEHVKEGDLCIDATMGNGNDTLLLSRLCGEKGHVLLAVVLQRVNEFQLDVVAVLVGDGDECGAEIFAHESASFMQEMMLVILYPLRGQNASLRSVKKMGNQDPDAVKFKPELEKSKNPGTFTEKKPTI